MAQSPEPNHNPAPPPSQPPFSRIPSPNWRARIITTSIVVVILCGLGVLIFLGREANKREALEAERQARSEALIQSDFWDDASLEDVQFALGQGANIHARDHMGFTPLHHWAIGEGQDPNILLLLLDQGSDVNAQDEEGYTPLKLAIMDNRGPDIIQLLLDGGGETQLANGGSMDLLWYTAANNTHIEIFALLLDGEGVDINEQDEHGNTLLRNAAGSNENISVTEFLLNQGANVHAIDYDGETPLHHAAQWNEEPAITQMLLDRGAEVDARNDREQTPLHLAIRTNEEIAVIKVLLANGASTASQDDTGSTALQWAELYDRPIVADLLTTDEEKAEGKHCIYRVEDAIDKAILKQLQNPNSYWPHKETMTIGHAYEMETSKDRYAMVHPIAMEFSADNPQGWQVRGTAVGMMFNENCNVVIRDFR